ncbi:MAG: ATP-binding protein [bacterium]|nr:ATP-binding protein [bacterium]
MKNMVLKKIFRIKSDLENPYATMAIAIMNVALLAGAMILYGFYADAYKERLREENLGNIANLNQAAAISATALINSWDVKLDDVIQYIESEDATYEEALEIIANSNSNSDRHFELIGADYTGHLARRDANGQFTPVSYEGKSYADLQKIFNEDQIDYYKTVCFAPEFTDQITALKYFAIYRHLPLTDENGAKKMYTLLLAAESSKVLERFNYKSTFEDQSNVLINAEGDYIVSNQDFKSNNFFQYLYVYNDLTLDKQNEIKRELAGRDSGELYYQNAAGQECVFRYCRIVSHNWYCVTCVPVSSFHASVYDSHFAVHAVLLLLLLMIMDLLWLYRMNSRLRLSMIKEKEAGEAKTDFLSRMSHDIRTPLNGIIGLTTLAMDESNSPLMEEYLDNIKVSGQFLMGLVNDILDLNKVESGKIELNPEPYSSEEFSSYVEAVVLPLCEEKGIEFHITTPTDEPTVKLDHLRFNQIFFNLLSNGVKYTPSGGLLELYWESRLLPDGKAALDFMVRDNGIGMSEEFQRHMFESFTQEHSHAASIGTGLGLAIVKNLVNLMNGTIDVTSKLGEGTTFKIHLEADVCEKSVEQPQAAPKADIRGRRVLMCEDNKTNIFFMKHLFDKWEVLIDVAVNGKIGVEMFEHSAPGTYDAILMDVMMPEMDGLEATRIIRTLKRPDAADIPIIAMTANAYDTDVKNCIDAGMDAHMSKPIDADQLQGLLNLLFSSGVV